MYKQTTKTMLNKPIFNLKFLTNMTNFMWAFINPKVIKELCIKLGFNIETEIKRKNK
jgi:hypothetical protein